MMAGSWLRQSVIPLIRASRMLFYVAVISLSLFFSPTNSDNSVNIKVLNHLEDSIQVFWINTMSTEYSLVSQTTTAMRQNSEAKIVTFPGHEFSVRLVNHIPGTEVNFTVGDHDETLMVYKDSVSGALYFQRKDAMTEFEDYLFEVINSCKDQYAFSSQLEERLNCVKHGIFDEMMRVKTSTKLTTSFRNEMANRLTDYMCNDETLESTTPVNRYDFYHNNQSYSVNVYLDTHTAKIWAVDDIISTEECDILAREGFPTLETAATTDEQGENIMTDERVAEQGRYLFEEAKEGADELWALYNRGISLVNQHAGLQLDPEGQEGITIVRYGVGGQYRSHCDGSCDGGVALDRGRVATGIYYCEVATRGGGTTFPKANVFIKPKKHMAVFFSYISPEGILDSGLTEHAGCPVMEGQKWIATTWLRHGVSRDRSCNGYDPTGIQFLTDQIARSREDLFAKGYVENDLDFGMEKVESNERDADIERNKRDEL